jgi:hypothetical protein
MWFLKHGSSAVSIASRRESLYLRRPTRGHSGLASSAGGNARGGVGGGGGGGRGEGAERRQAEATAETWTTLLLPKDGTKYKTTNA